MYRNSKILFQIGFSTVLAALSNACGSGDSTTPATTPATSASSLTASYATSCASCHGADGSTSAPGARTGRGVLKGTTLSEASFLAAVRDGSGTGMGKYDATLMSDADVRTSYTALTQ